jgi:hypothetical protein
MGLLFALLLIVAGALAASSLIVAKQPNAGEVIAKLTPYQGILGIILLIWALIFIIRILPGIGLLLQVFPLTGIILIVTFLVAIGLGFLLGYGLIAQYALNKNAGAAQSGQAMQMKLAKIQGPLGIVGIVLGLYILITALSWGMF